MPKREKYPISWTQERWNPIVGCSKISEGCRNCWAERQACRTYPIFRKGWTGQVLLRQDRMDQPARWTRPRTIAVCLMGDLFHQAVPEQFIIRIFTEMARAKRHTFQVLTKRPKRLWEMAMDIINAADTIAGGGSAGLPPNIWVGVSAEDQPSLVARAEWLCRIPAVVRFLSLEPLLGPVTVNDYLPTSFKPRHWSHGEGYLNWIVVGGESGPGARPMHPAWARALRDEALEAKIPFHFKQWGAWKPCGPDCQASDCRVFDLNGQDITHDVQAWDIKNPSPMRKVTKSQAGRHLDGQQWLQMPSREDQ